MLSESARIELRALSLFTYFTSSSEFPVFFTVVS
jgi:hypothetical protein